MPFVNVKMLKHGSTAEKKAALIADITRSLVENFGKHPEHIHIVIDEVDEENWGYAGMTTAAYFASQKTG